MKILFALFIGLLWWFVSRQYGASNPSINGVLVGGFAAIIQALEDVIAEIKKQRPK